MTDSSPDLQQALDETRQRFADAFVAQCDTLGILVDEAAAAGAWPSAALMEVTHRLRGLAGTIGFPTVSARAAELVALVDDINGGAFDAGLARGAIARIREAFTTDLANPPRQGQWEAGLPRRSQAEAGLPPVAPLRAPARPRTVVVADDDPDITRIVEAEIRAAGHQTILAVDGEQALAAVRTYAPDVLVLDLMMPKINGFEVLSKLGEGPAPRPRTIVLSARGREFDVVRAFALGADDYMTKPFHPQELVARLTRLLT